MSKVEDTSNCPREMEPVAAAVPVAWSSIVRTFATLSGDDLSLKLWSMLYRDKSVMDKYLVWKEDTARTFDTVTSSILCEKLGYHATLDDKTGKYTAVKPKTRDAGAGTPVAGTPYVLESGSEAFTVALHPNPFPYNIAHDVRHDVLWSERRLDHTTIKAQLSALLGERPVVWYENLPSKKSLPSVWHVHVFSEEAPTDSDDE